MAKTKNALYSLDASGAFAKLVIYSKTNGRKYAKKYSVSADKKSLAQLRQRFLYKVASLEWHELTPEQKILYNENAKLKQLTGYNLFISEFLSTNTMDDVIAAMPDATATQRGLLEMVGDFSGTGSAPVVNPRNTSTVGLSGASYTYDADMSPVHYSDAVNAALTQGQFGNVFLRGESVDFTSVSGKFIQPVNNMSIVGAGIDRTIITTARTDYVFRYRSETIPLLNSSLSGFTIDCQDIDTVSGIDIRNFKNFRLSDVKIINSSQWFARFGAEPSSTTDVINDRLIVEDSVFDTHDGIYEMLLVYNTRNAFIDRCTFSNKTGSPGAAPTVGIWQKVYNCHITNSVFTDLVSAAIYYAYTTDYITVDNCTFMNTGQALRGANVSDNGKYGTTSVKKMTITNSDFFGGENSEDTEAIQIGSVDFCDIKNCSILDYSKGIRIGFGNSTPSVGEDGGAKYPSLRGKIQDVTFTNINSADNSTTLNAPLYFANGGDFKNLVIENITVIDPNDHLDYAVIFNGGTTATATVSGGAVTGYSGLNTFGWYSTAPTVTITGNGTGATATATIDSNGILTGLTITAGGSGYTTATITVQGANYKNITFKNCDFGGKQIRVNDNAQLDINSIKFVDCVNYDSSNLSSVLQDYLFKNNQNIIMHDGKLGIALGSTAMAANTDFQLGNGSNVVTMRFNNVQFKNSNDNMQTIFTNFSSKTWTWYKNGTNSGDRRLVFDVDSGLFLANGVDCQLDTILTNPGLVLKSLTTTERNALSSPKDGAIIYNETTSKVQGRVAGAWVDMH